MSMQGIAAQAIVDRLPPPGSKALAHIPGDEGWPVIGRTLNVLADPKGALPGYDALLLVKDARLIPVLKPLAGAIPVELMRRANLMVDGEKQSPDAAAAWLEAQLAAKARQ